MNESSLEISETLVRLGGKPWTWGASTHELLLRLLFRPLAGREKVGRTQRRMGLSRRLACHYFSSFRHSERREEFYSSPHARAMK